MTDERGLPVRLAITPGQAHDITAARELLDVVEEGQIVLGDKAYDADWLRQEMLERGAFANIPPKANRKDAVCFSPWLYKARNVVERFFNKLKCFRRIATRYDKLGSSYLAMVKLAAIRIKLRDYESTA